MSAFGPYVHSIDPVIGTVFGVHFWWYGFAYSFGFLGLHLFLRQTRGRTGFSPRMVYDLTLLTAVGVLLGARLVEIAFYEWPFYREHPILMPAFWLGGMSSHGVLLGAIAGVWTFSRLRGTPFLRITDALVVPGAFMLGIGRIGNFIDGQNVGTPTSVWWAVQFPDAEGFRHPVVLYDGLKNFLLIPVLLYAGRRQPPPGTLTGLFLVLYASLRIGIDLFRVYPDTLLGLATGQVLNLAMAVAGVSLLGWCVARRGGTEHKDNTFQAKGAGHDDRNFGVRWRQALLALLVLFALVIPSDWTQDIPARYGKRHPGLAYSALYQKIANAAEKPHGVSDVTVSEK